MKPDQPSTPPSGDEIYDLNAFFNLSLDLLAIAGTDGYFKRVNPGFERTLGWSSEELTTQPFFTLVHPEDRDATMKEVDALARGVPTVAFENRYRCSDGSYRSLLWTAAPDAATGLMYCVARDVTARNETEKALSSLTAQLEAANENLLTLATTDSLTRLKNRRFFDERLTYLLAVAHRAATPLSLLMIDVDQFKDYNDAYGHPAGDAVLVSVASLLSRSSRASDTVARYGGEEFGLILPDTPGNAGVMAGEKLRKAVQRHPWVPRPVTISVGVSTASFEGERKRMSSSLSAKIVQEADRALYESKARGRNLTLHRMAIGAEDGA